MSLTVLALNLTGCEHGHGRPFTNSSADYNGGRPHALLVQGELEAVADAVVTIMEAQLGARLIKRRDRGPGDLVLSFRIALDRVRGATSVGLGGLVGGLGVSVEETRLNRVAYGGLFYVQLQQIDAGVSLHAIGLPVVDGLTACPRVAEEYRSCRPAPASGEDSFATEARSKAGVSVSGANEAEVLSGLVAQLQRQSWKQAVRPLPSRVDQAFDSRANDND